MTSSDPATPFFGRQSELQRLLEVTRKKTGSIVVIKGRRRVGKSRLTEELARRGILGLQFENLVLRNRLAIIERLGIELDDVVYDNPFVQRKTQRHRGCQIDYMIQTRHRTLYVCEIKFSHGVIPASVIGEVEHKVDCLEIPRRMTWRPVLIHVGEVVPALAEGGFATVDCSDLLG